jgi:hypothetical protein
MSSAVEVISEDRPATAGELRPLVAVVMAVATILLVLFELPAFVTVTQGFVEYPIGIDYSQAEGPRVGYLSDPGVLPAGVRVGQLVTWTGRSWWRAGNPLFGDAVQVQTPRALVTVRAERRPLAPSTEAVVLLNIVVALAIFIFAGVLCYKRPGIMTIALWVLLAMDFNIQFLINFYQQLPEAVARPIVGFINAFFGGWSFYPVIWFALRFPDDRVRTKAMHVADYLWTAVAVLALGWFLYDYSRITFGKAGEYDTLENFVWRYTIPQNIPNLLALPAFLWVYASAGEVTRRRLTWVIVGFILFVVFATVGNIGTDLWPPLRSVANGAILISALCPLVMIYAVLRHHLLDISFVVTRALVYSILTAIIVAVVAVVDWIAGKYLFETRAALALEAAIAIAIGFVLQRMHGALESFVDRVVFAGRHAAERHIERVIAALAFAKTQDGVLNALVDDPHAALDLASCDVFIDDGTALTLRARHGPHGSEIKQLSHDDAIARLLLSERRPIGIAEAHWHAPGAGEPALDIAVPLFSRNDLLGIAFYGRHRNGTAIDPEERDLLRRLCDAAAVAYEAVALARAREELAALRGA